MYLDTRTKIEFFRFCVFIIFKSVLLWEILKILNFVEFWTLFLEIFSANSCKLILFLPFLVITGAAELSVFKCTEVFCNKGASDCNAYFISNNSPQVYDSNRSFVVSFLWHVCVPISFSKIAHIAQLIVSKKWLSWVNHRLLMVLY